MIYTTKQLLKKGETEYSIRQKVKKNVLHQIDRGVYSTDLDNNYRDEVYISNKYPSAIITGLSAFYFYDLTDFVPEYFYLATEQHSFPIRQDDIKQSYQERTFFEVGAINKRINKETIRIYDLERLLIELIRLKEKYPKEIYYEVLNSFRKIKDKIDFYKLNQYIKHFNNKDSLLLKIKEAI